MRSSSATVSPGWNAPSVGVRYRDAARAGEATRSRAPNPRQKPAALRTIRHARCSDKCIGFIILYLTPALSRPIEQHDGKVRKIHPTVVVEVPAGAAGVPV